LEVMKKRKSIQSAGKLMRQSHAEAVRQRKKAEAEADDARRIHANLRDQYVRGLYNYNGGEADYQIDFARATEILTKALDALSDLDAQVDDGPVDLRPWTTSGSVQQTWDNATNEERNNLIRGIVDKVVVKPRSTAWKHRGLDPSRVEITWRYSNLA
ncbi:MAG: hypothetical protein EB037_10790, partial [Actinobacteria bacterium]|nr:hypothetical protein [Actinomycetota bacterium]